MRSEKSYEGQSNFQGDALNVQSLNHEKEIKTCRNFNLILCSKFILSSVLWKQGFENKNTTFACTKK